MNKQKREEKLAIKDKHETRIKIREKPKQAGMVFMDKYNMLRLIGDGVTSKVYLCSEINNPGKLMALKIFKRKIQKSKNAL